MSGKAEHIHQKIAIELHDSTVDKLVVEDKIIILAGSFYIHISTGNPGFDPGTGWTQSAVVEFRGGRVIVNIDEYPAKISDGFLCYEAYMFENVIPYPLGSRGPCTLNLVTQSGGRLTIETDEIRINLLGQPKFIEYFN